MNKIKYSYCLNENNELVHISCVSAETRHSHTFFCLECGQPLIAKIGKIKIPHFAHEADTACNGETYLHKLAKRRIREKFMSADSFPLTFIRDVPCQDASHCPGYMGRECIQPNVKIPIDLKKWKGNVVYDTCQEEVKVGEFRPDLLLTGPMDDKLGPVFIEVYKTHQSEEPKVTSGNKIIETRKIKTEADIDDIIENGFIEGQNCRTFNFSPKLPFIKKKDVPITRFILFGNGAAKVISATEYSVMCDQLNRKVHPDSIRELNIRGEIWVLNEEDGTFKRIGPSLNPYQIGLVYLTKKGMDIRNCILCKFYKENFYFYTHNYCKLGLHSPKPKQTDARNCPRFLRDPILMSYSIEELEKELTEVP